MAQDPRQLKPSELTRILNSTPLGTVIDERQMRRHRNRAGYRIGDLKTLDLFRYFAWLFDEYHHPPEKQEPRDYDAVKDAARQRNADISAAGRDIGELPEVVDPDRKAQCEHDFRLFCTSYFPETFSLPWSRDHEKVIAKIEDAVLHGGLFSLAMPRGSGKSSLCETACLWATFYGHREFVALIGSDKGHAKQMLDSLKVEIDSNELLMGDFPEICFPVQQLDGIANRCSGQLYRGRRTHIVWTADEIVLPSMEGSRASGAIVKVAGITGRIRGMKFKRPQDVKAIRPSLVVLDDPQTDESARSTSQSEERMRILKHAVLRLAGPDQKIAGVMPCTVIRPGDMADRILDREKNPEWNGERMKLVYEMPTNMEIWEGEYAKIREEGFHEGLGMGPATEFYQAHREVMDEGSRVAWAARHYYDEASAIQHAMNIFLEDQRVFFAEYQNEPLPENDAEQDDLTIDNIFSKINRLKRAEIPTECNHLTMFIDVQQNLLFFVVTAWTDDFSGYIVDYGVFPRQSTDYFTTRDARNTLAMVTPGAGLEGSIYAGLELLTDDYLGRQWQRDDGAMMRIDRCLIDANWGQSTDVVYQFCRQSRHAAIILPSHGRYVGASSVPFSEYRRKKGDRVGHNWRIPSIAGKRAVRHVVYDTNYWKSFFMARLLTPMGDHGCLSIFMMQVERHRLMAEHLTAEYHVRTEGRGRTLDEWKMRPERSENHWLDGLVGCAVGASIQGVTLLGTSGSPERRKPRLKLSELQKKR